MSISAVLIVRNEASRIERTVRAIRPHVQEVLVVDQASNDHTYDILYGLYQASIVDTLLRDDNHGTAEVSRPAAVKLAQGPWVLILDADEELHPDFAANLPRLVASDEDFWQLRRVTTIGGHVYEDAPHNRLFKKTAAHVPEYQNIGDYAHSSVTPLEGVKVGAWSDNVAIVHEKSWQEQEIDNARSDQLLSMRADGDPGKQFVGTYPWLPSESD
jgi:glycosyltransferase involved in cell wall biosynthesis